jgi:sirohydrochlorin ferrochelatase
MSVGIVLIAHGSRRPEANAELEWVADQLRQRHPHWLVQCAYLEIAEPTIPQAIACCVESGAEQILLVPYFLSAGRHVSQDLERIRSQAQEQYPNVHFTLGKPLGPHELLVQLLEQRIDEALKN